MAKDLSDDLARVNKPWRRRRVKYEGEEYVDAYGQKLAELDARELRPMCHGCRKRVPWSNTYVVYEMRGGVKRTTKKGKVKIRKGTRDLFRIRFHDGCGGVVQETNMSDREIQRQTRS